MTNWVTERLDHRPLPLESDGTPDGYVQRKNIRVVEETEDMPEQYECEMRFISVSEYVLKMVNGEEEI